MTATYNPDLETAKIQMMLFSEKIEFYDKVLSVKQTYSHDEESKQYFLIDRINELYSEADSLQINHSFSPDNKIINLDHRVFDLHLQIPIIANWLKWPKFKIEE